MTPPPGNPEDRDALAAEMALGLLGPADAAEARSAVTSDPAFRQQVARWRGRLAPLYEEIDPIDPPASLWERIQSAITGPIPANDVAANDNLAVLQSRVNRWRAFATGFGAIAAALAIVLVTRPPATLEQPAPGPTPAPMVASLADDQKALKLVASWDPERKLMVIGAAGLASDATHSHELWVIPADGTPRSLGTMPDRAQARMELTPEVAAFLSNGATIAVSVEPRGGSPSGLPTGPVIASGTLQTT